MPRDIDALGRMAARRPGRIPAGAALLLLAAIAAFAFGFATRVALADHYHTNCVGHGLVHGSSASDGSFHSRVEAGCGSDFRRCNLWEGDTLIGARDVTGTTTTCNNWSGNYAGSFSECRAEAGVRSDGVFASHSHNSHSGC